MIGSDELDQVAAALAAVQAELRPAEKNAQNPFLKNRYADLGAIIVASRDLLAANGLAVAQGVGGSAGVVSVETRLLHKSGQWLAATIELPLEAERGKSLAQAAGSVITYLRRYGLAAMLGVYTGDDTDGDSPTARHQAHQPAPRPAPPPDDGTAMTDNTRARMFALLTDAGIEDPDAQRAGMSSVLGREVTSRADLTEAEARRVCASLQDLIDSKRDGADRG